MTITQSTPHVPVRLDFDIHPAGFSRAMSCLGGDRRQVIAVAARAAPLRPGPPPGRGHPWPVTPTRAIDAAAPGTRPLRRPAGAERQHYAGASETHRTASAAPAAPGPAAHRRRGSRVP